MPNLQYRAKPVVIEVYLNEVANQAAVLLHVEDDLLTGWFRRQVGWWGNHINKLAAVMAEHQKRPVSLAGLEVDARLTHAKETVALLRERQHLLCCSKHGVQGVEAGEWEELMPGKPLEELYVAMANRGIFEEGNGNWTTWERSCERCLKDVLRAQAQRAWERMQV